MIIDKAYLDNNAATKMDDRVVKIMNEYFTDKYAVASSQFSHTPGIMAKDGLDWARHTIAKSLNSNIDEIVFTSGETESNNLAIKGLAFANLDAKRKKIIVSAQDDFSVLNVAKYLEKFGFKIVIANVDTEGFIDLKHLESIVDEDTLLVSVNHANHEVGNIQNIKEIAKIAHSKGAYFHSNGSMAYMFVDNDVKELDIDLYSISSDKIYGPKGVGALYVKKGIKIEKIMHGGYQEFNLRAGLENVAGIVGFAKAVEIFDKKDIKKISDLRNYLLEKITNGISRAKINGPTDFSKRLVTNLNISFDYVEGEAVILHLDMNGVFVITGSACFSRALQASHVLLSMGYNHERAHGSIRFSFSKYTTKEELDFVYKKVKKVVKQLRNLSPLTK